MLRRCVAVFSPGALDPEVTSPTTSRPFPSLDEIADGGTNGVLLWCHPKQSSNGELSPGPRAPSELERVAQVLGKWERGAIKVTGERVALRDEYKGCPSHLVTTSEEVSKVFREIFDDTEVLPLPSGSDNAEEAWAGAVGASVSQAFGSDADFVLVHLGAASGAGGCDVLDLAVRELRRTCVDERTLLVVLAGDGEGARGGVGARDGAGSSSTAEFPFFSPRQSCEFHAGKAADVCDSGLALSVVYSPVNHVRRDDVGSFSAFEARRSGGSGAILALHLLKGAMFSISRAPKYGS